MDNDSILTSIVPVIGAIYRSGREKPDIKWNFEVKLSADDIVLSQLKNRLQFFRGVKQRCEELNIDNFIATTKFIYVIIANGTDILALLVILLYK